LKTLLILLFKKPAGQLSAGPAARFIESTARIITAIYHVDKFSPEIAFPPSGFLYSPLSPEIPDDIEKQIDTVRSLARKGCAGLVFQMVSTTRQSLRRCDVVAAATLRA
jgi:hypothetical protein